MKVKEPTRVKSIPKPTAKVASSLGLRKWASMDPN
jgi:hypothetical protein